MAYFDLEITHLDGTTELIERADRLYLGDGVLDVFQRQSQFTPFENHLGSFPLASIRKYRKIER